MADTKYTMVGMTSAGKTCYITAMYMKMAAGFDGFTLVTDEKTRAKLGRDILTLREPKGPERFPTATNATVTQSYEFRLSYETKKIITFEMMDYAGGLLTTMEGNYAQVKESIAESTALYIFIDGKSFCTDDREERKDNVYYDCAMTVTPIIQDFADTHPEGLPPIVFVITKSDLCKKYISAEEATSVICSLFSPAFSEDTYSYICAVSLGDTISDDDYKGKFNPVNIHIPFFIGSYHEYFNRCLAIKNSIVEGSSSLDIEKEKANLEVNRELKKLKLFRNQAYIDSCLQKARNAEEGIRSNQELLYKTQELFNKFSSRLENESCNFEYFINGVKQEKFRGFKL